MIWGQLVLVFQQELWMVEGKGYRVEPGLSLGSGIFLDFQPSPPGLTPYPVRADQLPYSDVHHRFGHSYHI